MHTAAFRKKMLQTSLAGLKDKFFQTGIHGLAAMVLAVVFMVPHICLPGPSLGSEIRIADSKGDWGYPNPFRHYPRGPGYVRMSWVFDTLVWKDKNGYIPALADSWSYDPEKMAFAFTLNPRAKWHDGLPLTAADVVFTIAYFKQHPYRWISTHALDRAEAKDAYTVVIYLAEPYAPFLSDIGGTMPVLPEHIWKTVTDPFVFDDPSSFIGSGPYMFKDFNKTQGTYLFEAFSDYYQGVPKKERLVYVRSGKPMMSLITGQVDLANIRPDMAKPLQKKGLAVIENERGWNKKIMINHKKAPFNDPVFRRALAYAVNRQEIIDKAHRGFATPASHGLLSIDHDMYNPDTPRYPWHPEKAADMIASLGWTKGEDGFFHKHGQVLQIELISSNLTVAGERVADRDGEIIKKQLTDIGIRVHLRNQEQTTTDSRVKNWDFDLAISGHGGIAGDPRILSEMISPVYGAGSVNSARFDDCPELNRLLEAQMVEMDPDRRRQIVFKIQALYAEQMPAISLYYPDTMAAFNQGKEVTWFYTRGGISKGIPIPQNKMSLLR
ncbi:MAG: ABC transporter substrate-binding protein [Desulfotignum sp.]|nr:ABC transporter substrate-binding protein [Desulfotignum sp.]